MRSEELKRLGNGGHRRGRGLDEVLDRIQGRNIQRSVRFLYDRAVLKVNVIVLTTSTSVKKEPYL